MAENQKSKMPTTLTYPFTRKEIRKLKVGERVLLSGRIFTGRDRLHKFMAEGGRTSISLKNGAIYHCGPVVIREKAKWSVRAAGPTTSIREEPYMAAIIKQHGLTVIIGKGGMGEGTLQACRRYGCVYLHAVGGAAQVLADTVKNVSGVYFRDTFGPTEALWELEVADFPCLVTMDAHGHSLHAAIAKRSEARI
ncbi:MAG: FumA C-terminus/TtdB family hydratase beta subunit [Verrucomicrobia bacterium]|nr:FumA C-terminus/TtdB family hydratase beta subunit [Verrucomicrobiota bacterium]MBU1856469.1 FumA C-terminus/TtdB family hydratase beta subunit [Verrucomicrobiota bacterium]